MTVQKGKYPESFYRVSLKAIVRNENGEVLVVKEKGSEWSLPGGGIDHGETPLEGLKRELYEEVLVTESFAADLVGTDSFYVETKDAWLMWLVYSVKINDGYAYGIGEDADEVAFMDPHLFKESIYRPEQLIYKWCVLNQIDR